MLHAATYILLRCKKKKVRWLNFPVTGNETEFLCDSGKVDSSVPDSYNIVYFIYLLIYLFKYLYKSIQFSIASLNGVLINK